MARRNLMEKERILSEKSLKSLNEELDYNNYQKTICDLKLKDGLRIEYEKNVRDYKQLRNEFESQINIVQNKINILNEQLEKGVEIKKIVEVK